MLRRAWNLSGNRPVDEVERLRRELAEALRQKAEMADALAQAAARRHRDVKEYEALKEELKDALEQQAATAETLRTLSRSAFDLDAVLDTLIESAMALCSAATGLLVVRIGGEYRLKHTDAWPAAFEELVKEMVDSDCK